MKQLQGRSTVGVMTTEGAVYAFRFGSPLILGKNATGESFLSSDVLSLSGEAEEYAMVANGEVVTHEGGSFKVGSLIDETDTMREPSWQNIDVTATKIDKEGYDHFMLKEIFEQPQVWSKVMDGQADELSRLVQLLKDASQVFTLGAGSASFAAGQIAWYLRQAGVKAQELKSYEARSYLALADARALCIAISQSGETADTNEVIEWFKAQGVTIVSLVNMSGSTLSALSNLAFKLQVGPEVCVASTKALTGQMVWGYVVSQVVKGRALEEVVAEVRQAQDHVQAWLDQPTVIEQLKHLASHLTEHRHLFILGRGQLYYPALESALKMKEVSYIHTEGFSGGELKHGVIALLEKGTPVVSLIATDDESADMLNATAEVKARGGWVIGISPTQNQLFDEWIEVPELGGLAAVGSVLPAQLLTYHLALLKGLDPDKPRNLAKSVTVK
jgi:glucosamine--fructose-6-phosphate aminotransferase (isomerizing)